MNDFLHRLQAQDRVLLVGDVRQHQAVEAGRPYQQLQEAGIAVTARLDDIVRQQDPALKQVVEQLSRGEVHEAIEQLDRQGRVHEIDRPRERLAAIAREYAEYPDGTLVVAPDHRSRTRDQSADPSHDAARRGRSTSTSTESACSIARQEITGADRQWAEQYDRGDVVRYTTGSQGAGHPRGRVCAQSSACMRPTIA